jgi:hypothetical protein
MKRCYTFFLAAVLLLLSLSVSADTNPISVVRQPSSTKPSVNSSNSADKSVGRDAYTGTVRTYIVEPVSRWRDLEGHNYGHAFLDWGPGGTVNIADGTRWESSQTWNSVTAGIGTISSSNIEATTAVFTSTEVLADADPGAGYYFLAHYCDAAASGIPGTPGHNETAAGFTHSVFVEEATATWCQYCPATRKALEGIYGSHDYPFHYASMVCDVNGKALDRMSNDYNFAGYPSCFFDGGYQVFVGGSSNENDYRPLIQLSGARDVPPLDVLTVVNWLGANSIEIKVRIGNGVPANYAPDDPTITSGPTNTVPGDNCEFETSTTDQDSDQMYYRWDWGDGTTSDWMGPYDSGTKMTTSHTWQQNGEFAVKVQAKDDWDAETSWSADYSVKVGCCIGLRGNVNNDSEDAVDISDLIFLVDYSFGSGPAPVCADEADVNGDLTVDITDLIYLVDYSFGTGPAPISCQ